MNSESDFPSFPPVSSPSHNLGEMSDADAIGTVGSPECGDMLRVWVKFREENGKKLIDKATFQTFGCQTALAVAHVAMDFIAGKTPEEALALSGQELAAPLGALPPMKIHCAQLVEAALKDALQQKTSPLNTKIEDSIPSLVESFQPPHGIKMIFNAPKP